jgi:glycosyltransferase involved in cell wall biosynthesis
MKIAQIAPLAERCPPLLYGGTERVVSYLTEALVELGHEVTLFASGDSVSAAELVPCCKQALRLDESVKDAIPLLMTMMDEVSRRAREFDVLHFHIDLVHAPLVRPYMERTVTTLHGRLDLPDLVPFYDHFCDLPVVSISDSQRGPLPRANWIGTVHHGLPRDLLPFSAKDDGYLAFIGRISPEKRPDRAIEIAAGCGARLKIAAKIDRADEAYWRDVIAPMVRAHPNVEFIGEINEAQKAAFLGRARAVLFPIDWEEPFGLVMIEAMACGTPVIAFRRGSVAEVIDHGVSGFIVEDIAGAVRAVQELDRLARVRVRAAFDRRFSVERMARDYVDIYRTRAAAHRARPAARPQLSAVSLRA